MKKKIFGVLFILVVGFFFGPSLLHLGYRAITTEEEKEQKKKAYLSLADAELYMPGKEEIRKSQHERERIYYWFHSRGWSIDEGDGEPRFADSWRKLFRYWNENGA